jgi:hypothetical protein
MSVGQSTSPGLERASDRRELTEVLGRVEQLERTKPDAGVSLFGSSHQAVPLGYYGSGAPNLDVVGYAWVADATSYGGGYVEADADDDYFTGLVLLEPKGSVWQFNYRHSAGPDYGRFRVGLASLEYESADRPSGDSEGKIAPVDGSYGSFSYVELTPGVGGIDLYSATAIGDLASSNSNPFIVGGDVGDPLSSFTALGNDPYTGFPIMDGGPGWYRMKIYTDGKNASSSGFRIRLSEVILTRRADDNAY